MIELQELVNAYSLTHMDVVKAMEKFADNEDVLVALRNFDSNCSEAFEVYWEKNEVEFINEEFFKEYAWDCLIDFGTVSRDMLGYINIEMFVRDLKMDFYPVELDRQTFWGRY